MDFLFQLLRRGKESAMRHLGATGGSLSKPKPRALMVTFLGLASMCAVGALGIIHADAELGSIASSTCREKNNYSARFAFFFRQMVAW
jgi:hypothetical protein